MQEYVKKWSVATNFLRALSFVALSLLMVNAYSASKTVLVLGDSLSAEYGLPRGAGWVSLLEKKLKENQIDANVVNASISGETTSGGRARLPSLLDKYRPNLVILELGGNDGLRGLPVAATQANIRAMVMASKKVKSKVLLVGMQIPPNYGRDYAENFSRLYTTTAKEAGIPLVPFLLAEIADKPQLFQADRIHPTAEAHPIMLNNIWPHLKPLLQ
jgi:acyl-CoA thioesterase I